MIMDADLRSIQEVRHALHRAKQAQALLEELSQAEIDSIIEEMAYEAELQAEYLAQLAVEETGFGNVADKKAKNMFVARDVFEAIQNMKTVGIISRDELRKVWEVASPIGVIAGIIPSTNPTSTVIFKAMIALKARNAIVFSPHPSAKYCCQAAAQKMQAAAERKGAPSDVIQCLEHPTMEAAQELMRHRSTDLILATGGVGMVKAAYSSGKPAYGVGPGNVPVYVHHSADISKAAARIAASKIFDYGTICASEQAIVVDQTVKQQMLEALNRQGAILLTASEKEKVGELILSKQTGGLNPQIVGKSVQAIADMAGISIPANARILIAEETQVGKHVPFSIEKLSPLLALYTVQDDAEGCERCKQLLQLGGLGHTLGVHAEDSRVIETFGLEKPASRIIVNAGTTFGGIGMSTGIFPSMTLGCGSFGNNITTDNIGPQHLMNIKRVAFGIREVGIDPVGSQNHPEEAVQSGSAYSSRSVPQSASQQVSQATLQQTDISREEVMEIVKKVLAEMNG